MSLVKASVILLVSPSAMPWATQWAMRLDWSWATWSAMSTASMWAMLTAL